MMDVKLPPQNLVAEQSVLGGLLLHQQAFDDVSDFLRAEDFYAERNRIVFAAIRDMQANGRTQIDSVTVAEFLEKRKELADAGGPQYLVELLEAVPHAAHTRHYAEIVVEKSRRRSLESFAMRVIQRSGDQSVDTEDLIAESEADLFQTIDVRTTAGPEQIGDILVDVMASLSTGKAVSPPVPTTFRDVDEMAGGYPIGGLTILGARPSSGKTALMCGSALRLAEVGEPVLFCSYEQNRLELPMRLLAIYSGIAFTKMQRGWTTPQENQEIVIRASMMSNLPVFLDTSSPDINRLQSMIRRQVRKNKIKVAFVDYLQLIDPADRKVNREQQVAQMTRSLKRLAMQLGISIVVASQLNRDVEKRQTKRPTLADLRESGAIEQDADLAMLMWRPHWGDPDGKPDTFAEIVVAKQRNGPTGVQILDWHAPTMTFRDQLTAAEHVMDFD
jgi:replicative DNA helicase